MGEIVKCCVENKPANTEKDEIVVKENSINSAATGKGKKSKKENPTSIRDEVLINGIVYY